MKKLTLLCLLILPAFCQINTTENPPNNNNYGFGKAILYPDDFKTYTVCTYIRNNQTGQEEPLPNAPVTVTMKPWTRSGYHTHESTTGAVRPSAVVLGGALQVTGPDPARPCVDVTVQLPGIAGWYVFESKSPYTIPNGLNQKVMFYGLRGDQFTNTVIPLVPLPEDTSRFVTQNNHRDQVHGVTQGDTSAGKSFYMLSSLVKNMQGAADYYLTGTKNLGIVDRLNVTRCALPWGGIADNDWPTYAPGFAGFTGLPEWRARLFEEHSHGTECDLVNPKNITAAHTFVMLQALDANNCPVGKFDEYGTFLSGGSTSYWANKDIMHVTCGRSARPQPRP